MSAKDQAPVGVLEAAEVQAMFDRIAGVYDLLNGAMTAGLHHRWRALAAARAGLRPGCSVLDVATGTGDLALQLAQVVAPDGEVLGTDFSEAMLDIARTKQASASSANLRFEWADAMSLPYPDDKFDAATVGFGARNFSDLSRGLAEMARVVKPGGRVVVLELTAPQRLPLSVFYALWFDRAVPLLGGLAGLIARARRDRERASARGHRERNGAQPASNGSDRSHNGSSSAIADAYMYLPSSVKRFPAPEALAAEMASVGLGDIKWVITAGGIIAIHAATVQPEAAAG
jgi:demethylmenaquinone methyltransferase / 2-methoxy-6-polyprenyl-1,4-benzoquinol methylase